MRMDATTLTPLFFTMSSKTPNFPFPAFRKRFGDKTARLVEA